MRKQLRPDDLGDLLDLPINAIMATYRKDGQVLLSPVWHEWRDGGFNVVIVKDDLKHRHLKRDPRMSVIVCEDSGLNRSIELRGVGQVTDEGVEASTRRMTHRYLGPERAGAYIASLNFDELVLVRLEPGELRAWDFADES